MMGSFLPRSVPLIATFAALAFGSSASAQSPPGDEAAVLARADGYLNTLEERGFRGVVLIARDEEPPLLFQGYGFADCDGKRPMTANMVFDIGSITKAMTATAVLDLVAAGKIGLSDSLGRFFEGVPADKAGITVEQLLRHTSGLPDILGADEDYVTKDWILEHGLKVALVAPPGDREAYSNLGYSFLAAIIEAVTGTTYEEYLAARLFAPLGLEKTGYMLPHWDPSELACGIRDGERWGATRDYFGPDGPSWHLRGNGGIHSTAAELDRWFHALLGGRLLPSEITHLFVEAMTHHSGDVTFVASSGSNLIFTADYLHFLDSGLTVIVMTSDSRWPKEEVTPGLAHLLRPLYAPSD